MNGDDIFGREPVLLLAVINSIVGLAVVLWPDRIEPPVQAAILTLANTVVAFIARSRVSPA
jgi:hypothetical protein